MTNTPLSSLQSQLNKWYKFHKKPGIYISGKVIPPLFIGIPHIPERKGTKLHFHYLFELAAYYDGDWKSGLPHGYGRLIYDDGSMY